MSTKITKVVMYTDGSCTHNPGGNGGYAAILCAGQARKELASGLLVTTNNRMEIMGAILGLEALKWPCTVLLFSDSRYLVDTMQWGWITRWEKNQWRGRSGKVKNVDLWQRLQKASQPHKVEFQWLRGHDGDIDNERCDQLAKEASWISTWPRDVGYAAEQQALVKSLLGVCGSS